MCCPWCGEEDHIQIQQSPHRGLKARRSGYYCFSCRKTFTVEEQVEAVPWYKRRRQDASSQMSMQQ